MSTRQFCVRCDVPGCPTKLTIRADTGIDAWRVAVADHGWTRRLGAEDRCPDHTTHGGDQ